MKFENPKMNISMFEMESVEVTTVSTNYNKAIENAKTDVQAKLGEQAAVSSEILAFEF